MSSDTAEPVSEYPRLVVPGLTPAQCAILARARTFLLYRQARADLLNGKCPFCVLDPKFNVVCAENEYWYAWPSKAPEKNTTTHLIIAPKRHVKSMNELDDATEGLALLMLLRLLNQIFGITASGLLCRDGDARLSAGTVEHLHLHKMVPNGKGRVESPFFKGAEAEAESNARAIVFEKLHLEDEDGPSDINPLVLTPAEQALVKDRMH